MNAPLFVCVDTITGYTYNVNPAQIKWVSDENGACVIGFGGNDEIRIPGTADEFMNRIYREAQEMEEAT